MEAKPGQLELNAFERAILERITEAAPALRVHIARLRVLSRKFTGVGSYTYFFCEACADEILGGPYGMPGLIDMPDVQHGMGAVLFCERGHPKLLETYTYDGHWDGRFEGFSFTDAAS